MNHTILPDEPISELRTPVIITVVVCVAVAIAPWLTGGQQPLGILISVFALLLGSLMLWRQPEVRALKGGPLVFTYGALVGWALLSLTWSVNRYSSALWIIGIVLAGLVFRLTYAIAREARGRELLIRLYLGSAVLFCGYALWLYATGGYGRLTGSFYWANPAAAYLIPAVLIALRRMTLAKWWPWAGLVTLLSTSFILADSRGATLVLALVLVPYILVSRHGKKYWIHLLFTGLAIVLLATGALQLRGYVQHGVASTTPGSRFTEAALGESRSGKDRFNYLVSGFKIWETHPFLGTGAGTYRDVHPAYQMTVVSASANAHNFYVQSLSELGLFGFLLVLDLVIVIIFGMMRGLWRDREALPLILGAVALLVHMGLDIDASYPALLGLLAMLAGLIYSQGTTSFKRPDWRLPAVAALTLVPVISYYQGSVQAERAAVYQSDGDAESAADLYGRSHQGLLYNPDWVNAEGIAHYALAMASAQSKGPDSVLALDRAHMAEGLDPSDGQHHQLEGRVLAMQGNKSVAIAVLKDALRLDPYNHPDYAYDLARVQRAAGDTSAALTTARAMLTQYPKAVITNRSADTSLRPSLVGLATFVGTQELILGNLEAARAAAAQAVMYDASDFRTKGLQSAIAKAQSR